jgi:hypothetical protein
MASSRTVVDDLWRPAWWQSVSLNSRVTGTGCKKAALVLSVLMSENRDYSWN